MKSSTSKLTLIALLGVWAVPSLRAANTPAGTSISNSATINYQVSGVNQTAVNSNTYTFLVDRKINHTVTTTDGAAVAVPIGSTNGVLTFTLQNTGNGTQDYSLSAVALYGGSAKHGGTDNVNATSVAVYVESGATPGYQSGQDTGTHVNALAINGTATVYIVGNFSSGTYANGDIASYHLMAEARINDGAGTLGGALTETSGAETTGSEDTVFADGQGSNTSGDIARDAKYSDFSDFSLLGASLTVTKSSVVISDPSNNTTNPKAIPGAVVEYTITISNAPGASTATNITFSDSLNSEIVAGNLAFNANAYASGKGIKLTAPNLYSGAATDLTNAGSDDEADFNITATNTITVSGITVAASESATIKFRVTVQ